MQSALERLRHLARLRSEPRRRLYVLRRGCTRYRVEVRTRSNRNSFGFDHSADAEEFIRRYEPI